MATTGPTEREIVLEVEGLGILMYSPSSASHIQPGEDYLQDHYEDADDVAAHVLAGTLVGFCTGSPGTFRLRLRDGYPDAHTLEHARFKLRLGLNVTGGTICFRDLYDLMDWAPACPAAQQATRRDGHYHVTLCSSPPASGVLGDDQTILVYLQPLAAMPTLRIAGVPQLCD